jgi:type I restriction enzyme S subunit
LNQVRDYDLPLPTFEEQKRITKILKESVDGISTAKDNAEKNLQNARALFESHLHSVLNQRREGWVATSLDSCCSKILAGGDVPKDRVSQQRTPQYCVPIYSNGVKNEGLYGFTDIASVMNPSVTISARGTIGFSAIRTEPFLPVVRLMVLVPNEELVDISFLHYSVMGMDFGNTGTSIPQLTVPNLRERQIYIPQLEQQRAIVANLDAIREETQSLESIYQQKLASLDALKKSLLDQAFTGEL